jgi:cytochrome c553
MTQSFQPVRSRLVLCIGLAAVSCTSTADPEAEPEPARTSYANWAEPLALMPHGPEQTARVCARPGSDPVRDAFCNGAADGWTSLSELQTALHTDTSAMGPFSPTVTGSVGSLSINAHSTGLAARSVSAINPRVIAVRLVFQPFEMLAVGFTRGEQFVELVARDHLERNSLNFYLAGFRLPCNDTPAGCTPGDLLTPAIEHDWTEVSLYDEVDLANTTLDCAPCHQPAGPGMPKMLRLQEFDMPWTHWFWPRSEGGRALLADYTAAKGDEPLAGMTAEQITSADPQALTTMVALLNPTQPNEFDAFHIEAEVRASSAAKGCMQPFENHVPGESATWRTAYELAMRGDVMPVPYHDVKVTDAGKLTRMTAAYRAWQAGELARADLPDIRNVFLDDPQLMAEMAFSTDPSLDGRATLVSACSLCHNSRLDQTQSRARFRPDLDAMTRAEKDIAISRLKLPPDNPLAMPPARSRVLSDAARRSAIEALEQ